MQLRIDSLEALSLSGLFFTPRKAYSDRNLYAVSFMSLVEADDFVLKLEFIDFTKDEVAFLTHIQEMVYPVDWNGIRDLEYKNTGRFVKLAYQKREKPSSMFVAPPVWLFKGSISDDGIAVLADSDRIEILKKDSDGFITVFDKLADRVINTAE